MSNAPTLTATLPAGTYVVGDPCYSIPNEMWMAWLEQADYTQNDRNHVLVASVNGHLAVGVSTAFGDGEYFDQNGNTYPVDAGLLGLVPIEVAGKNSLGDERVIMTFDAPVDCFYDDENVVLGPVIIETGDINECEDCGDRIESYGLCDYCQDIRDSSEDEDEDDLDD